MDIERAKELNQINSDFYQRVESSFSSTRQLPWKGWERLHDEFLAGDTTQSLSILDLACGNLRFERYLTSTGVKLHAWAIDNCDALANAQGIAEVSYQHLDIVNTLLKGEDLAQAIDAPACDVCVCFGFMHHLALAEHRLRVLEALVAHTRPGGIVAASFWQFERDPRILAKAKPLGDEGNYLLGWQDRHDVQRYCHSFSDAEIDRIVEALAPRAMLVSQFRADGKRGDLNTYIAMRAF